MRCRSVIQPETKPIGQSPDAAVIYSGSSATAVHCSDGSLARAPDLWLRIIGFAMFGTRNIAF
jgi:hypothetical protein